MNNNDDLASCNISGIDSILSHLASRYDKRQNHTMVGSDILISLSSSNAPSTPDDAKKYAEISERRWLTSSLSDLASVPHPYDLAGSAFYGMLNNEQNQSILIRYDTSIFY
jgi:myosin heavy subunit